MDKKQLNEIFDEALGFKKKRVRIVDYKWFLFGTMILFFILEILGETGYSPVAVISGWLIGLMTMTQWRIKNER